MIHKVSIGSERNTVSRPRIGAILCMIALFLATTTLAAETADDEISRLKAENAALREQINELQKELTALRDQLAALSDNNEQLETQTKQLESQTLELEAQAQELQELAGISTDQRIEAEQTARIKQTVNAQTQENVVSFGPEPLDVEGSPGDGYFSVVFRYPQDASPAVVEQVEFYLLTAHAGRYFKGTDPVAFIVNGQRQEWAPEDYEIKARRSGMPGKPRMDRSDEKVVFRLDREQFAQLSDAVSLSVRRGTLQLMFDRDDLAALRALQRRLSLETPLAE